MGQFMRKNRLLLVDVDPVEHVDSLGFGVVIGLDLLLEKGEQKGLKVEIAIEHAELFQDDFTALQALGSLIVLEFLIQIAFHGGTGRELALDGALDRSEE